MDHSDDISRVWFTAGPWIGTGSSGLHIFNALDENGVESHAPLPDEEHSQRSI